MPEQPPTDVEVRDDAEQSRYELLVAGTLAGFAVYRRAGEQVVFTHTEIEPERSGQGLGGVLVRGALEDVRDRHLQAVPLCPFVAAFIRGHADYLDVVDARRRGEFAAVDSAEPPRG